MVSSSRHKRDADIFRDSEIYVAPGFDIYLEDGNEVAVIFTVQRLSLLKGYYRFLGHYGAGGLEFMCLSSSDKGRTWHQRALPEVFPVTKKIRRSGHFYYYPRMSNPIAMPDGTLTQWTGGYKFSKFREDLKGLLNVHLLADGETWTGTHPLSYSTSTDGGETWSQRVKLDTSPYPTGGLRQMIALKDGGLLASFSGMYPGEDRSSVFFMSSSDMGRTWSFMARIPPPRGITFYEPGIVQTDTGRVICMIRAQFPGVPSPGGYTYLYQSQSNDGGATWTEPKETDLWGHPADLIVLGSGRILCAYGHRKLPFGVRVAYSEDDGETWRERILRVDGCNIDLGYPCSVQLEDGTIFTAYYFNEGVVDMRHKPADYYTYAAGSFYTEEWLTG